MKNPEFREIRVTNNNDKAIFLFHGFAGSPYDFSPLLKKIDSNEYDLYSFLLKGHGTTPFELKETVYQEWITQILNEYDSLSTKYKKIYVIGFSMGGALSAILCSQRDIDKLVLISPYFKVTKKWYYILSAEGWARLLYRIYPMTTKPKIGQINNPDGLAQYNAYKEIPNRSVLELAKLGEYAKTLYDKIKLPCLCIHSENDDVADYTESLNFYNNIQSKEKKFLHLVKSNHIIFYDYDSEIVIEEILNFIKEQKNE